MSDFLQNLRNNSSENKKYHSRRKYPGGSNGSYSSSDKKTGDDKRNNSNKKSSNVKDNSVLFESIRMLLEDIGENQREMLLVEERQVSIEEKKLDALKNIATSLEKIVAPEKENQQLVNFVSGKNTFSPEMETVRKPGPSDRETIMEIITNMRNEGATFSMIAQFLDKEEFPTFSGKGAWHAQTVHRLCQQMDAKEL